MPDTQVHKAHPDVHVELVSLEDGEELGVSRNTQHRLWKAGLLHKEFGPGIDKNGRACRPRQQFCKLCLLAFLEAKKASPLADGKIDINGVAAILGKSSSAARVYVGRRGLKGKKQDIHVATHVRRGLGTGEDREIERRYETLRRTGLVFDEAEVKADKAEIDKKAARDIAHVDERGWTYLPKKLFAEHSGLSYDLIRYYTILPDGTQNSCWYLDGREQEDFPKLGQPYDPKKNGPRTNRPIETKHIDGWGRGRKRLCLFLEADGTIIRARREGKLSAEEARKKACEIRARLRAGMGAPEWAKAMMAELLAAPTVQIAESSDAAPVLPTAALPESAEIYITAKQARVMSGLSYSEIKRLCRDGGPVRWRKPTANRLELHPADFARFLDERLKRRTAV